VTAKEKTPSFGEALAEVEAILARLEKDEIDVDELSGEVKRAVTLVDLCREKLQRTELEVQEFTARLREDRPPPVDGQGG
jgi:exodeoxyribonuclease VII small subunit